MLPLFRLFARMVELLVGVPRQIAAFLLNSIAFNPRLGPLRYVAGAVIGYVAFAVVLVYVAAPLRGAVGQIYLSEKIRYDAERWLATAIYDAKGEFAGTFDPRLDSRRDVNFTDSPISLGDYTANPDHKSIPVRVVPEHYWQCLKFHEDRHLGGLFNPYGIDFLGVLKIPYSTVKRSIALKRPALGVGGSTLPMQFVRVIYKTPPDVSENAFEKLRRKLREWWLAPVIFHELTRGGDDTGLKQWAANHLWLAQRTGGPPLHGIEVTSQIVFGKQAQDLSIAEQFVLASAVKKPIILMEGSERLNEVRLDRWRYISEVRARTCANKLIGDEDEKKEVLFELVALAGGPPDARVKPKMQMALEKFAPGLAERAYVNPAIRANALMRSARFGLREEMKQDYGFGWRQYVRGVTSTLDSVENIAFAEKIEAALGKVDKKIASKISSGFTLDRAKIGADVKRPNVVVVAANARGEIVRYFEAGETAPYFGSIPARSTSSGFYEPARESRMIASTGKIIAAIAIANGGRDHAGSLYLDTDAPRRGLETCVKRGGQRHGRKAIVAFACSLNNPLLNRTALAGQSRVKTIIDRLGFTMPPADSNGEGVPPSTAAVLGQISGSPRRVHQMSGVVLASLLRQGKSRVRLPTLVKAYDYIQRGQPQVANAATSDVVPNRVIRRRARPLIRRLLSAPLCYSVKGRSAGTLKSLKHWCASRRSDLRLHFAKTGTQVTADPNATVDVWLTGGLQFRNGAAYSYVVLIGTGSGSEPWATGVHASQAATPLAELLFKDLAVHAKSNPKPDLLLANRTLPAPASVASVGTADGERTPAALVLDKLR